MRGQASRMLVELSAPRCGLDAGASLARSGAARGGRGRASRASRSRTRGESGRRASRVARRCGQCAHQSGRQGGRGAGRTVVCRRTARLPGIGREAVDLRRDRSRVFHGRARQGQALTARPTGFPSGLPHQHGAACSGALRRHRPVVSAEPSAGAGRREPALSPDVHKHEAMLRDGKRAAPSRCTTVKCVLNARRRRSGENLSWSHGAPPLFDAPKVQRMNPAFAQLRTVARLTSTLGLRLRLSRARRQITEMASPTGTSSRTISAPSSRSRRPSSCARSRRRRRDRAVRRGFSA